MSDSGENSGQEGSSQGTGSLSRDPSEAGDHNGTSPGPGGANNDQNGVNGDQSALPSVEPDVESEAEPEQPSANIASPYQPLNGVGLNSDNTDTEGTETDAKGSAPHFPLPATRHENTPDINSARQPQHDGNGTTPNGGYHNGVGQSDASGQASSRASSVPSSVPYSLPEQANPGSQTGHVASAEGYTNGGTVEPEEATSSSWGTPNTGSLSPSSPRSPVSHRSDRSPSPGSPGPPGPQQPPGQGGSSGGTQNNGNGDSSPPNQSSDANSGSSPGTGNQGQTSAGGNDSGPSQTTNSSCVAFNETSHRSVGTPAPAVGVSQGSSSHTLPHHPTHLDPTFPANTLLGQVPSTTRRSRVSTSMNPIAPEFVPSGQPATRQEFTVPRWQPDSEVRNCPICDVQFGMFLRKHHCRKCGRVVCDRCSPHRITIPHAYIVRPPGDMGPAPQHPYPGIEGGIADFNTIGGGQRVRLCNPCVPDPNTTPPQAQPSPRPIIVDAQPTRTRFPSNSLGRPHRRHASQGHNPVRTRSVTTSAGQGQPYFPFIPYPPAPGQYPQPGPAYQQAPNHLQHLHTPPEPSNRASYQVPSDVAQLHGLPSYFGRAPFPPIPGDFQQLHSTIGISGRAPNSRSSISGSGLDRPLPRTPMPEREIPEEDACPVCHSELPSRTLPNYQDLRETHINNCITSHTNTGRSRAATATEPGNRGTPSPQTTRRTRMFPYKATEKDCINDAECIICLVEFAVGDEMARLECFCAFHRTCIDQWFVKHPGRCPIHQHGSLTH